MAVETLEARWIEYELREERRNLSGEEYNFDVVDPNLARPDTWERGDDTVVVVT